MDFLDEMTREAIDMVVAEQRQMLERDGGIDPLVVAVGSHGQVALARFECPDTWRSREVLLQMGRQMAVVSPVAIAAISDVYYRSYNPGESPQGPLSGDPQAQEALCLVVSSREGRWHMRLWPYRRTRSNRGEEEVVWQEPEDLDDSGSTLRSFQITCLWEGVREAGG